MNTSKSASENTFTGIVTFRPGSLTPIIRVIKGDEVKFISIMVEDYDKARALEGQTVKFKIITSPYGPHILSDNGFALLI